MSIFQRIMLCASPVWNLYYTKLVFAFFTLSGPHAYLPSYSSFCSPTHTIHSYVPNYLPTDMRCQIHGVLQKPIITQLFLKNGRFTAVFTTDCHLPETKYLICVIPFCSYYINLTRMHIHAHGSQVISLFQVFLLKHCRQFFSPCVPNIPPIASYLIL